MYNKLYKFWLTKWYIEKISKGFEIIYPGDKYTVARKVMKTALLLWSLCVGSIVCLITMQPSLYTSAVVILFIVIAHYELVNGIISSMEIRLLKQFEKFLSDVRHSYYINRMVEESIADAMEYCGNEMKIHALKIFNILNCDNNDEDIIKYNDTIPNKYLRMFLAISATLIEYGDQEIEGQSLFLTNIKILKNDIHIQLLKLSDTKFRFSGLVFITVLPVFFLRTIKNWSISNLPELAEFYSGFHGILLAIGIYILTIIAYVMLNQLKEVRNLTPKDHFFLDKILSIPLIHSLLENYIVKKYGRILKLKELLKKSGEGIPIKQFILKRFLLGGLAFMCSIVALVAIHIQSGSGYLRWIEVIIALILAYLAYCFPYWMVLYRRKIAQMNMEDEIIQFQSIIMMVMHMNRISVLNILEFMESFALIFKETIQDCINDYNSGDIKALEEMREKEVFEPFKRLVDNLIICDQIGIEKAFDEISTDHLYYQDKRKQENEMNLSKKVVLGKLIAYVPLMITIGFYLITPFIKESLRQLLEYGDEWNML